jgi:hypothetical protein
VLLSLTLLGLVVRGERRKKRKKQTIREPVSEREREKGREEGVLEVFRRKAHAYRRPPTEDYYSVD